MTPAEMLGRCQMSIDFYEQSGLDAKHAFVALVFPKAWKAPAGFPRRTLACVNPQGTRTYHVNAVKLRDWVNKQLTDLADVETRIAKQTPTGVSK